MHRSITILSIFMAMGLSHIYADRGIGVAAKSGRFALVIGNGAYETAPLRNPANDARDMAALLERKGFAVDLQTDADQRQMEEAIRTFGKSLRDGGVGLFFYAGHGMQVDGSNYLIPVGTNIEMEAEVRYEAVDANRVLSMMESAGNDLNMVFLDACRNNPFARSFRSSSQGLAQMDAPKGSFVAFATAPGAVAADGEGRNGLFTGQLLKQMQVPGLPLTRMMMEVRKGVLRESDDRQTPWDVSSLTGDFYFTESRKEQPVQLAGGFMQSETTGTGRLLLTTNPPGSEIVIDGVLSGTSPLNVKLKPGIYTVEAKKRNYKNEEKRVRIFENGDLRLELILDRTGGTLSVKSAPPDAEVEIDRVYSGTTPLNAKGLDSGQVTVKVKKKGYQDWQRRVSIEQGRESRIFAELKTEQKTGTGMVSIPAGEFRMGSKEGGSDEKPVHTVYLDQFLIDKQETTVADYRKCVDAGKCDQPKTGGYYNWGKTGRDRHPINGVDWFNAKKYCEYAGKRLPTEAEWERAASWKNGKKYKYPSGKSSVSCADAVMDDGNKYGGSDADGCGKDRTWPVGSKPKEINGTYDMAGNVWEWVLDWYDSDYYSRSPRSNPQGPDSGSNRVFRGGGWGSTASDLRGANRSNYVPSHRYYNLGFRCVASP